MSPSGETDTWLYHSGEASKLREAYASGITSRSSCRLKPRPAKKVEHGG